MTTDEKMRNEMHIINIDHLIINHAGREIFRDLSWAIGDREPPASRAMASTSGAHTRRSFAAGPRGAEGEGLITEVWG